MKPSEVTRLQNENQLRTVQAASILRVLRDGPKNQEELDQACWKQCWVKFDRHALTALVQHGHVDEKDGSYAITEKAWKKFRAIWEPISPGYPFGKEVAA